MKPTHARTLARILIVAWAGFWTWFSAACGHGEVADHGIMALLAHLALPAVMLAVVAIAWRWEALGIVALLGLAAAAVVVFTPTASTAAILVGPPVLAAGLLALAGPRGR